MDWKALLAQAAPILAGAVAGPAGPVAVAAVKALAEHFGVPADEQSVAKAVQGASPEQMIALKQVDLDFAKVDLATAQAAYGDTDSARKREIAIATSPEAPYINKVIGPILALVVVIGGGLLLVYANEPDVRMAAVSMMTLVLGYFFGTTAGKVKDSQALRDAVQKQA